MRTTPTVLLFVFSLLFCQKTAAQQTPPSIEELQRQLFEMQRRMMEQFQQSPFTDPNFAVPRWDTTFFFRFDTIFEGSGNLSQFFRFSPFGSDSTRSGGFGFDRLFDQFFNLGDNLQEPDYGIGDFPADDGNTPPSDDGLLPEERLRQQEEAEKSGKKQPKRQPAEAKPDPKIKTIRI